MKLVLLRKYSWQVLKDGQVVEVRGKTEFDNLKDLLAILASYGISELETDLDLKQELHKERERVRMREYRKNNPGKVKEQNRKGYQKRKERYHSDSKYRKKYLKYQAAYKKRTADKENPSK